MYFLPFAKMKKVSLSLIKIQSLLKPLLWTKGDEWVKVLNALGPLCLWQCIKTNPRTIFFWDCHWNTLWKSLQSITCELCISFWKMITARTLRAIDFTLTFYHEIWEILRLFLGPKFLRPIPRLSRDQIFQDQYWDFFETKNFEVDTETCF